MTWPLQLQQPPRTESARVIIVIAMTNDEGSKGHAAARISDGEGGKFACARISTAPRLWRRGMKVPNAAAEGRRRSVDREGLGGFVKGHFISAWGFRGFFPPGQFLGRDIDGSCGFYTISLGITAITSVRARFVRYAPSRRGMREKQKYYASVPKTCYRDVSTWPNPWLGRTRGREN